VVEISELVGFFTSFFFFFSPPPKSRVNAEIGLDEQVMTSF